MISHNIRMFFCALALAAASIFFELHGRMMLPFYCLVMLITETIVSAMIIIVVGIIMSWINKKLKSVGFLIGAAIIAIFNLLATLRV